MENFPIIAKEKKLNIFQQIRLKLFERKLNRPNFDIRLYENSPEYIKRNDQIINELIRIIKWETNYSEQVTPEEIIEMKERNLLKIPEDKLIKCIGESKLYLSDFLIDNQIKFVKKVSSLIKGDKDKINFSKEAIKRGQYEFITIYPNI